MPNVITLSAFRPRSTRLTFIRLLVNNPADTSSAIDRAICTVASVVRNRAAARAPDGCPDWPFSVETRSAALTAATRVVWSLEFTELSTMSRLAYIAAPPTITGALTASAGIERASAKPSTAIFRCFIRCPRRELFTRECISPARDADRASSRLAMFAHAISSTKAVTPSSSVSGAFASRDAELCPFVPASSVICFARNFAIV